MLSPDADACAATRFWAMTLETSSAIAASALAVLTDWKNDRFVTKAFPGEWLAGGRLGPCQSRLRRRTENVGESNSRSPKSWLGTSGRRKVTNRRQVDLRASGGLAGWPPRRLTGPFRAHKAMRAD